jgi:N-acetylglucosamine-6-phosphate deacetylase
MYDLGGQTIAVAGGVARADTGSLAGSTLTLDKAVLNVMDFARVPLPQALAMASRIPAEAMGIGAYKGTLKPGADADVILFDDELKVHLTMVMGQVVYEKGVL